jgi:hypothetical protein
MAHQLAQVNVARLRHPADDPRLRPFFDALARVNKAADAAPGFVWRHEDPNGHLRGGTLLGDDRLVVNLSVWESYQAMHEFVYYAIHGRYLRRKTEWFERLPSPYIALWWVPEGTRPTPQDALTRWRYLRAHGPTPQVFTIRHRFDEHGRRERPQRVGVPRR